MALRNTKRTKTKMTTPNPEEILDTILGTELERTWLGVTRTASDTERHSFLSEDLHGSPAASFLGVSYKIINTKHPGYRSLTKSASQVRTCWVHHTLPWVKRGIRILRKANYDLFHDHLNKLLEDFNKHAAIFCTEVWPHLVEDAKTKWGSYFNPSLYPVTLPEGTFSFSLGYPDLEESSALASLDPAKYAQMKKQAAARVEICCQVAEKSFAAGLQQILASLQDALTPGTDAAGNLIHKKVPTTTIKALSNFYKEFKEVSITDHHELNALFEKALNLTTSTDFKEVKSIPEMAASMKKELSSLASSIHLVTGATPVSTPVRKLNLKKKAESEAPCQEESSVSS